MSNTLPTEPLSLSPNFMKSEGTTFNAIKYTKPLIEECLWALEYPELQKACFLARVCAEKSPAKCSFYNIAGILQVGPTCGLTALSMLLGGVPPAEQLLQEAQRKHFTNNGEMFSAYNLYELICDNLPMVNNTNYNNKNNNNDNYFCQPSIINTNGTADEKKQQKKKITITKCTNVIECQMHEGLLNCPKVKKSLEHGACIFVPYPF